MRRRPVSESVDAIREPRDAEERKSVAEELNSHLEGSEINDLAIFSIVSQHRSGVPEAQQWTWDTMSN